MNPAFEKAVHEAAQHAASVEQIARNLIAKSNDEQTFTDAVMGFVSAVDWTEEWLWLLVVWHVLLLAIVIATRREWSVQLCFLSLIRTSSRRLQMVNL